MGRPGRLRRASEIPAKPADPGELGVPPPGSVRFPARPSQSDREIPGKPTYSRARPTRLVVAPAKSLPKLRSVQIAPPTAIPAEVSRSHRKAGRAIGEKGGGARRPFTCVPALLRAQSDAHSRCPVRHAKSGKQVHALIRLQPSTSSTTGVATLAKGRAHAFAAKRPLAASKRAQR
jgi:hypothetical protein